MLKHFLALRHIFCLPLFFLLHQPVRAESYVGFVQRMAAESESQHLAQPSIEQQLLELENGYRRSKGLNALAFDPALRAAARAHALDMAQHHFMGHVASTGHDFDSRMHALHNGAMILPAMGENAAMVSGTEAAARKLFKEWLASPPHQHTMVSRDYLRLATGVVVWNGQTYADQIFVGPEVQSNFNRAPQ